MTAENDAPIVVRTEEDMAALWFHLTDAHGLSLTSIHGDPFLMHGALTAQRLCAQTYADGRPIPPEGTERLDWCPRCEDYTTTTDGACARCVIPPGLTDVPEADPPRA